MRKLKLIFFVILFWLQHSLWLGKNGVYDYLRVKNEVRALRILNMTITVRNAHLFAIINDLQERNEAIEERARNELSMIRPGESFYRIVNEKPFQNQ
ncbi:MAG: cell division protein FtsB [Candidatus Arsenophonus melophagi]|nr:cell division protein FtsB [Candidatus Arsenophonus melophagi]